MNTFFALCFFALVILATSQEISANLAIQDLTRNIEAGSHIARHTIKITLVNNGASDEKFFHVSILKEQAKYLSYIHVLENDKKLLVTRQKSATQDHELFFVNLLTPLASKKSVKLVVKIVFVNQLAPLPREINQGDSQKVLYKDSIYWYTPYKVASQITTAAFSSSNFESFTQVSPTSKNGENIVFGPYTSKAPFSLKELKVHFTAYKKFLTITKLTRILELSHWGNLAVEEHYDMKNSGPALKGNSFSRLDYQRTQNQAPTSFNNLIAKLPRSASDIYYRDRIGNISTSTCRPSRDSRYLEFDINPRFPLFGQWKTQFYMGYNQPINEVLSHAGSHFKFSAPLGTPFDQTVVEDFTLKIILPEGAKNIKISPPFEFDSESQEVTKTYLDITGRPTLVFKKKNTVDEENTQNIVVEYDFSFFDQMRKPLVVVGFLFLFSFTVMIYGRIDLSLSKGKSEEKQDQLVYVQELVEKYVDQELLRMDLYTSVQSKAVGDLNAFEGDRKSIDDVATALVDELKKFQQVNNDYLLTIVELESKEKKKWEVVKKIVSDHSAKKDSKKYEEEYDALSDEIDNLMDDLKE